MRRLAMILLALFVLALPAKVSADVAIPHVWETKKRLAKPDLSSLPRLRFLTTTDFFPFNFLDEEGRLSGFHVDLSRAICDVLAIAERCQIQALPWNELEPALASRQGEAIIAGLAITSDRRMAYAFTRPYLQFPARFLAARESSMEEPVHRAVDGQRVGVLDASAHEEMLRDLFPSARPVTYSRASWLMSDLKAERIDAVFGDGMRLGFWLAGEEAEGCCKFLGGPYLAPEYLGQGLAIAVDPEHPHLADALDYALQEIELSGTFDELYLRYFPGGFY
ncbi:transporter substrate-binding domain-containing protein [Nitratireductor luteus]|uniref:transporter substrate-binding domain-containing protein n=1 Tax=Nitratireductor luteus TaxID=2976980 RepID=UPI00223FA8A0|nr:transporter substrate-binding domain-containing protein [Nitratireductor luteus]